MTALTCEQATQEFFKYLDRALRGEALADLEAHLDACLSCCDKLAFTRKLDAFIKRRVPDAPVPPNLEARVRAAVARAAGAR
jgi:mycothiol system anti-sigma-R factor